MENADIGIRLKPALQQPDWDDPAQLRRVREELLARPSLVAADDVRTLRGLLARVAAGQAHVVQVGDCAEDPAECTPDHVARKAAVLDLLAGSLRLITGKPVLRVGRIAGQYAKPRSRPTEVVDGVDMPVFRGHMVNGPEPDVDARRPDPLRLLTGYMAADDVMRGLGWRPGSPGAGIDPMVWTSHEALLLDYEVSMLRGDEAGGLMLASTHWPWIGERTRQVDGAHVELLSRVSNPVACKVGPNMSPAELLALCERLDPDREPGRLTLIARMGADAAPDALPPLVTAVREAGHPVIWLTDPMHGNTVSTPDGYKTRYVETVEREAVAFHFAVTEAGGIAGGFHLETTPDAVTECVSDPSAIDRVGEFYTSHCDPRLNPGQAISVVSSWSF
ncbi:3-deoxy-7-phosphoheptulonate synthase [Streptomyces sp. NBC_00291]|uniref:3-deoxy-7-phosphoheptulonate synthase n=1 Tax=Streptomyces sp. NBC_00291 TaxID=2975704 RepID=UPI00224E1E77|nr:3-deoxy-7-phosphoheptulonate synthase [Streptomyces sp. NBC_00291]MCX5156795.1 3-deoxy-7-phosphoheptulonate synthase [Streptomyces sp. NBC_00291]